jgi:arylsulfatase A-like enzyme
MRRPNLIMILIDDLGWRDLACYGSSFYETPNLDRLAAQGMRFTDAYAGGPVCSPSRASLMTGKSPARVGVTNWIGGANSGRLCDVPYFHGLPEHEVSLATALRAGGYRTWHVGKWHLGDWQTQPEKHGFEVNLGGCGWGYLRHGYFSPYGIPTLKDGPPGEYLTDRLTDEAIALIRDRDPQQPFFLNLWHYAVHSPHHAPAELIAKYERKAVALGLDRQQAIVDSHVPFPCHHLRGHTIKRRVLQSDPRFAAMVENLDTNVGRVLTTLDQLGIAQDTLVVFTSDNGGVSTAENWPTCNLPLAEGKGWMYEGGTRVCQIARWPGRIAAGAESATPTIGCDWYPTFLSAAGLPLRPEQHVDGVDLMPLLRGGELAPRDFCWHYPHYSNQGGTPACSIRRGDWKLIEFFEDGALELYDLRRDLGERRDVADEHPQVVRELHARLRAWRDEVEALIPKPNPNWVPTPLPVGVDPPEV